MPRLPARSLCALAAAAALTGVLAGCGSTASTSSGGTGTAASSATSAAPPSTLNGAPVTTVAPRLVGGLPAVAHATDLHVEPVLSAGGATPPSSLRIRDLVVGTGATPTAASTVEVQYVGALYTTGSVFDASWTDSGPTSFPLANVVAGFRQAILGMKVGGRREVVIPPALGYGAAAQGPIPANSTLVFVIDLLAVGS